MRREDKLGYLFLFCGLYVGFGLNYLQDGVFLQGMALGCFARSAYLQIKEKGNKK